MRHAGSNTHHARIDRQEVTARYTLGRSLWLGLTDKDDVGERLDPGTRNVRIGSCSFTPDGARKVADKIRALAEEAEREVELINAETR